MRFIFFECADLAALLIQLDLTQYSLKTKRRQDGAKGALQG